MSQQDQLVHTAAQRKTQLLFLVSITQSQAIPDRYLLNIVKEFQ